MALVGGQGFRDIFNGKTDEDAPHCSLRGSSLFWLSVGAPAWDVHLVTYKVKVTFICLNMYYKRVEYVRSVGVCHHQTANTISREFKGGKFRSTHFLNSYLGCIYDFGIPL